MRNSSSWKWINLSLLLVIVITLVLLVLKVWMDSKLIVSPLIPKYTAVFTNGGMINIMCFLLGGAIPALYLRYKQMYIASTICLILFFSIGAILKDVLTLYVYFYGLSEYL